MSLTSDEYDEYTIRPAETPDRNKLKVYDEEGTLLLDINLQTGELYLAVEDRLDEAAQIFFDTIRGLLIGSRL